MLKALTSLLTLIQEAPDGNLIRVCFCTLIMFDKEKHFNNCKDPGDCQEW